ncbi:MAG: FAD-dependent oxidoreductase [Actinobacteria bacterium]|nr:FAD-dependent oxidoreductase [Actinomycetota bacterium]
MTPSAPRSWDLVVIGGGSAGLVASKTAAGFGARVLLVESGRLGGDCLWTGCVPSKALIAAAADGRRGQDAFARAFASVRRAVASIAPTDSREALEAAGVTVISGRARFTSPRTLNVDGTRIAFRQALIATGATPVAPIIEGADATRIRTTEDFWELTELPPRLVVLGGGAVGCELGHAMGRLGATVTVVQRGSRILPREEPDASEIIERAMTADGVSIRTNRTVVKIRSSGPGDREGSRVVVLDNGEEIGCDVMLAALGRRSGTAGLGLEQAGVRTGPDGFVIVDRMLRTSNRRIWAAGDVTGAPMFTHTAGVNGSLAASNAILGLRRKAESTVVPRATFTAPEVAAVGLQAADAVRRRHRVVTWSHDHADRAIAEDTEDGYTRIVVDHRGRILGGTIVSPRAGETVGELALAVHAKLTTADVAGTIHPYPTFNDPLWNTAIADVRHRLGRGAVSAAIGVLRRLRGWSLR